MDAKLKKAIVRATKYHWSNRHDVLADKQHMRERWAALADHRGMVAMVRSGMDCDCTQYRSVTHMPVPVSLMAWAKEEQERENWLDGPESTWFDTCENEPEGYKSADRALEAYEDGHPHHVSWGDL